MKYKTISIIIPVYNEEKYILKTLDKVVNANSLNLAKEIIVVDDKSNDQTLTKLKTQISRFANAPARRAKLNKEKNRWELIADGLRITILSKNNNEGKCAALKTGISASTGDIVLVQDADLEYTPDDYPTLLEPFFNNDADVVYGSRFISNRPHRVLYFWHSIGNNFLTVVSNIFTNLNLTDMEIGYKVFKGEMIRKIAKKLESKRFGFEPEVTARVSKVKGLKIFEVGVSYTGRTYEEGKKLVAWKDGLRALYEIVRFNLFD